MVDDFCTFLPERLAMPTGVGNTEGMNTTTTTKTTFWTDLNGRVCCQDHIGANASYILNTNPRIRIIETDITVWERMTGDELTEWSEFLNTEMNETELCETCRWEFKNK